jgi:hypothetical protein
VPGIIALLLLIVTVIVMAMGLARERETGTLEQVMVTPMSSLVLMVGKLIPYVLIGLFDFALAIVVATYLFDVPLRGPLSVAVVGTTAYLICTLGIGLVTTSDAAQPREVLRGDRPRRTRARFQLRRPAQPTHLAVRDGRVRARVRGVEIPTESRLTRVPLETGVAPFSHPFSSEP